MKKPMDGAIDFIAPEDGLRVVRLRADNFKRLVAVDIEIDPELALVEVSGANGSGKTSLLDAVFTTIQSGRGKAGAVEPIRVGRTRADVVVDLGEIMVKKTYRDGAAALVVTAKDGSKLKSPQMVLDALYGDLSFDPVAFMRLRPKEQVDRLLQLCPLTVDLNELADQRQRLYDERTVVGRDLDKVTAHSETFDLPSERPEPISLSEVLAARRKLEEERDERQAVLNEAARAVEDARRFNEQRTRVNLHIEVLRAELVNALAEAKGYQEHEEIALKIASETEGHASLMPEPDFSEVDAKLEQAEQVNAVVRSFQEHAIVCDAVNRLTRERQRLTNGIEQIDEQKASALAAANLPLPGLSFDEAGVLYNAVPLADCSTSEQLRCAVAIAMAANPTLRIIRISDGSLLDRQNKAVIEEMVRGKGFQAWIEEVDETGEVGIYMEGGEVRRKEQD